MRKLAIIVTDDGQLKVKKMKGWDSYESQKGETFIDYIEVPPEIDYGNVDAVLLKQYLRQKREY